MVDKIKNVSLLSVPSLHLPSLRGQSSGINVLVHHLKHPSIDVITEHGAVALSVSSPAPPMRRGDIPLVYLSSLNNEVLNNSQSYPLHKMTVNNVPLEGFLFPPFSLSDKILFFCFQSTRKGQNRTEVVTFCGQKTMQALSQKGPAEEMQREEAILPSPEQILLRVKLGHERMMELILTSCRLWVFYTRSKKSLYTRRVQKLQSF